MSFDLLIHVSVVFLLKNGHLLLLLKNHDTLQKAPVLGVTDITDTIIIVVIMQVRAEGLSWEHILLFKKFLDERYM